MILQFFSRASCYEAQKVNEKYNAFFSLLPERLWLGGSSAQWDRLQRNRTPGEKKYGASFFLQEMTPTPSSGTGRGGFLNLMINMFKDGNTCPKFIACSSDTLSMLLSPVLNSFKCLTFLCLHFVIFRQTWNLSNDWIFGPTILQKHVYCSYFC